MTSPSLSTEDPPARQARLLLRAARSASLGTIGTGGLPSVTLVTPATAPDLSVLLLLSRLSEHRRNLEEDARCGLMVTGTPTSENPQTAPRLSLSGRAELVEVDEQDALRRRWLAAHPYGEVYAGFTDFALWRFVPERAQFIGGFAAAHRLRLEDLLPPAAAVSAIAAFEAEPPIAAVDVDGCDVVTGDRSDRVAFRATVESVEALREALERVVRAIP